MNTLTIVIPAYNVEKTIYRTVQTLSSSYSYYLQEENIDNDYASLLLEVIIVDDGSDDNTYGEIQKLVEMEKNFKISYLYQENSRQGSARNLGIDNLNSKFVAFVDADDTVGLNYFKEIFTNISSGIDFCYFGHTRVYRDKHISSNANILLEDMVTKKDPKRIFVPASPVLACYKVGFLSKFNIRFPEKLQFEDIYFSVITYYHAGKIKCINSNLYNYQIRDNSTVRNNNYLNNYDIINVLQLLHDQISFDNNISQELEYIFIVHLLIGGSVRVIEGSNSKSEIDKIIRDFNGVVMEYFPNWKENKYITLKQKLLIKMILNKKYTIVKCMRKINNFITLMRGKLK